MRWVSRRAAITCLALAAVAGTVTILPGAGAETVQRDGLRVHFEGELTPRALPRSGAAPLQVSFSAKIAALGGKPPPQLRRITIEINRHGRLDRSGLPVCTVSQIQPTTTADALRACRASLVGEGSFSAKVLLPEQAPFPSEGKVYAFNGSYHGQPAILAHVYGTRPAPTSYTLPFLIGPAKGAYGTTLSASLPQVTSQWGYVSAIGITLGRDFEAHGKRHAFLSGSCPAPVGFPGAVFPLARGSFGFSGAKTVGAIANRSCKVDG
jgi:hypothetical protein